MVSISDLDVVAQVMRDELSLGPLDINDDTNFILGRNVRLGAVAWRRETATSPYVHGRIPVHEVKDAAESTVTVYALGGTPVALRNNIGVLLQAFTEQWEYQLALQLDGVLYQWRCERADYEVGFITETLVARFIPVTLSFHRHPIPVQGVM